MMVKEYGIYSNREPIGDKYKKQILEYCKSVKVKGDLYSQVNNSNVDHYFSLCTHLGETAIADTISGTVIIHSSVRFASRNTIEVTRVEQEKTIKSYY